MKFSQWIQSPYYESSDTAASTLHSLDGNDEAREWRLDYHFPRGITPLSHDLIADALIDSSSLAAAALRLPGSNGLDCRTVGTFIYTSEGSRNMRDSATPLATVNDSIGLYPQNFRSDWSTHRRSILSSLKPLEDLNYRWSSSDELASFYRLAVQALSLAWTIHFDVMYRLLLVHASFLDTCQRFGVDGQRVLDCLPIRATKLSITDDLLRELAAIARAQHLQLFLDHAGADLFTMLEKSPECDTWMAGFRKLILRFGNRSDGVLDVGSRSWNEDPTIPLDMIRLLAIFSSEVDVKPRSQLSSRTELTAILKTVGPVARSELTDAIANVQRANFSWWNEEHNFYVDLRAHIPIRNIGLAVGTRYLKHEHDALMLFGPELVDLCNGGLDPCVARKRVESRTMFYEDWATRGASLPTVLGDADSHDPIFKEMFGSREATGHYVDTRPQSRGTSAGSRLLRGFGIFPGVVRGRARTVRNWADAEMIQPGEIMICRGTTPAWRSAFTRVSACVCEMGGPLSHAAIASRETGTPCVVGVKGAFTALPDGTAIEVDGSNGTVRTL